MTRATYGERPVRILHIVGGSAFGGGSMVILDLVRAALAEGHTVDVLTTEPLLSERTRALGGGVIPLSAIERRLHPWYDARGLLRLVRYLRTQHYDVVHTHTSKAGVLGRLAARMAGVPVVVHTMHGMAVHDRSPQWAIQATAFVERLMARCADRVVTVSEWHRDWSLRLGIAGPARLLAIPNGVRVDRSPAVASDAARRALDVDADRCLILCVSRIAAGKGLEDLVRAVAQLRDRPASRPVALRIAGTGPAFDAIRHVVHEAGFDADVVLVGHHDDVDSLLAAADVVVHPSHREGLSLALLESMMAECVLVASAIPTAREATGDGDAAWLYPPGDVDALAAALRRAIGERGESARHRLAAGERARREYSVSVMQQRYETLYRRLLLERSTRSVSATGALRVAAATADDLPALVALHRAAFPGFFLTRLGAGFLSHYYTCAREAPGGIVLVVHAGDVPVGFVCGSSQPDALMRALVRRAPRIALTLLLDGIRRPSFLLPLTGRILARVRDVWNGTSRRPDSAADRRASADAELTSIAVHPHAEGRGLGRHLVAAFADAAAAHGATHVYLTTDASDNTRVQQFYESIGFAQAGLLRRGSDRAMIAYRARIAGTWPSFAPLSHEVAADARSTA